MITITVLQDDIDNGQTLAPGGCPIALAVRRELPQATRVAVFDDYMAWGIGRLPERDILLPDEAKTFIRRFDNRLPVEPFKFEIEMEPL